MDTNWAEENLQTIRTLMERSALYRRALAPIMICTGVIGIGGAVLGWALPLESDRRFELYWMIVAIVAVLGALVLIRRQAVRQGEVFWSPPMRRVAQAMLPAMLVGFVAACFYHDPFALVVIWPVLYGLAMHAAGFFMPRGIRLFGWIFLAVGLLLYFIEPRSLAISPHLLMGLIFGASHLAYGIYLYLTEPKIAA
jgi:hypothetical protein